MKKWSQLFLVLLFVQTGAVAQSAVTLEKLSAFTLQSSAVVTTGGDSLSRADYVAPGYWFPVTVPCTVLTGLVRNGVYPDPYSGMNNMLIPDASDTFNRQYDLFRFSHLPNDPNPWKKPYWYRTSFAVPAQQSGKRFQLLFKGINYRAEVWVNGKKIADSSQMAGMFAEYSLNVSEAIQPGKTNGLAVKIYPLDFPGLPSHPQTTALGDFYDNGGPTGDIGKNVTMLSSVGWDWIPEVRDRNIGIWQPVYLRTTGHVIIKRPQITTTLCPGKDSGKADIDLRLSLDNDGSALSGRLQVTISPENFQGESFQVSLPVTAKAGADTEVHLDRRTAAALRINKPSLWWPNGYGKPNLYRMRLRWIVAGKILEDSSVVFGIRSVSSQTQTVNGWVRRDFYVNGRKIHLVGGAWVPDMMLNRDSLRNDLELRLCQNARVNLVRIWGGGLGETDDFYAGADRYGLLVWQDFWITGDTHGGFKGSADWPLQASVFMNNVRSTIYRLRNHPSLLVWTGGNEGHAREELYNGMRDEVAGLDGSRPFIPCSSGFSKAPADWKGSWPDDKPAGVYSGGPYAWVGEKKYFDLVDAGKDWVFKDETGIPSQPPLNSLAKIIPDLIPDSTLPYPLNNSWGYHDACSGNGKYDVYYKTMTDRFGPPDNLHDFSIRMQLLNASGYRAIFESAGHKLDETGGVMLWKLNAAFPSVIWQIFDWYLEPNAGYYFMQTACEPLHLQWNYDDSSVSLINRIYTSESGLKARIRVLSVAGKPLYDTSLNAASAPATVQQLLSLRPVLARATGISFVVLDLKNGAGESPSRNTYWLAAGDRFQELKQMEPVGITVKVLGNEKKADQLSWRLELNNPSHQLAFFINPQLWSAGQEIMPSFWSANYFTLPPGEKITVSVSAPQRLCADRISIRVDGWNVHAPELLLQTGPVGGKTAFTR